MPEMNSIRDIYADASRDGSDQLRKEDVGTFVDMRVPSLADEKQRYGDGSVGMKGAADIAAAKTSGSGAKGQN